MLGVILGSGLGAAAQRFSIKRAVELKTILGRELEDKIPPLGHARKMYQAHWKGRDLWVLQGRLHYYEGFPMDVVVEPIKYLKTLGVDTLILSFACGALKRRLRAGDIVVLRDHIHMQSANPLRGTTQFIDCTEIYDKSLRLQALKIAKQRRIRSSLATYASTDGPSYETPAEVSAFRRLGADVVGMSVTAEALVARSLGMRVLGLGWVSNLASGLQANHKLSHQEVLDMAKVVEGPFSQLLLSFIENYATRPT